MINSRNLIYTNILDLTLEDQGNGKNNDNEYGEDRQP